MKFNDFIFNYRSCLSSLLKNKSYFIFIKRSILLPYKYLISIFRDFFLNTNIDKEVLLDSDNSLDSIFKHFDCDKSSAVHGYSKFYFDELEKLRKSKINILEFGIHYGASQAAFCKYFKDSKIIGVDKNPYFKKFFSKNIRSLYCDVSDSHSLYLLRNYLKEEIDLIIDDASHIPNHQLKTFTQMFDVLKSKGIYVIEELDVFKSFPESYNKNLENNESEIRDFLYLIKDNSIDVNKKIKNQDILSLTKNIEWVKILRGNYIVNNKNISEIAFIKKK